MRLAIAGEPCHRMRLLTRGMAGSKPVAVLPLANWTGLSCGLKARWSKIASVACIESTREVAGRVETEKRYVISSLPADSRPILHAVRTHWGIENNLHWCLDVTFGEDASTIRLRNAALNFSFRLAMNLFRADKSRAISLPRKIKTAAYNPDYLASALKLQKI